MPKDTEFLPFEIELDGKLNTADNPTLIGKNFSSLKNLRYDDKNPKSVGGMTKINTNPLDTNHRYAKNAFHFHKDSPAESHVLVQTVDTSSANPTIIQNTTAIPNIGDFEGGATTTTHYTENTSAETAYFSDAPNGQVVICDGVESLIWGGNEMKVASAFTSSATITTALTNPKDYTSKVQNSSQDADQRMLIRDGTTNTILLLHCEGADASTTFTDSSATGHTLTAVADAQIDTDQKKFGSASGKLDGTGDYITVPDHAEFNYSDETFVIDTWIRPQSGNTFPYTIYSKRSDASNWMKLYLYSTTKLLLHCNGVDGSTTILDSSPSVHTVTTHGNVQIDTSQYKYNSSSVLFDGTGDYLSLADHADFDFSGGVFNISLNLRLANINKSHAIFTIANDTNNYLFFGVNASNKLLFEIVAGGVQVVSMVGINTLSANQWYHVELSETLNDYKMYLEGQVDQSSTDANRAANYVGDPEIGAYLGAASFLDGWIDELRICNGAYIHNAAFPPPAAPYKPIYLCYDLKISGNTETIVPDSFNGSIDWDTWHHIQLDADGTKHYLFVDGILQNAGGTNLALSTIDFTQKAFIGVHNSDNAVDPALTLSDYFRGWFNEFRIKSVGEKTADFTPQTQAYSLAYLNFLIGSTRPLKGCKFYIPTGDGNTLTSTLSMKEWNGSSWTALTISDGTSSGGKSLVQTGSVSWNSTVSTSKIRYFEGYLLYWYNFTLSAGSADIYQVTVDAPMQKCLDIWDGKLRTIFSYYIFSDSNYNDYTVNVTEDSYDTGNSSTYVTAVAPATALNTLLTAGEYQYVGSFERLTALEIHIIGGHGNAAAGTMEVAYWNGTAWIDTNNVIDGTLEGGATFAKSGVISWNMPDEVVEFRKQIAGGIPLYYYRLHGTANFSAVDIQVYYIAGIPAQNRVANHRFSLLADNCLWLCDDVHGKRNEVLRSFPNAPDVFNGTESFRISFGDEKKLTCATVLNSRKDDRVLDVKLFYKNNSMFGLTGFGDQDSYQTFEISRNIGCPAPLTLKTSILETEDGNVVPIAIWQGANGLYIYNDFKPIPIHRDIRNFFDKNESNTRKIHASYIGDSVGFIDEEKREYHWIFIDGSSARREFVFDLRRFRWFEIVRGTGKELRCGLTVEDTDGNNYNYGFISTGYMERLENGTDFDGTSIVFELETGANALYEGSMMYETIVRFFKLLMKTKSTTTANVQVTHYGDGDTTGTALNTTLFDPTKSGYDFTGIVQSVNLGNHVHHGFKLSMTTNNESVGFEPIKIGGFYKVVREDKR